MNNMIASRKTLLILIAINALVFLYLVVILPPGVDFRAFYFGGETIRRAPDRIYDVEYQRSEQLAEFKDPRFAPFFHPPHELLLFAPLSKLPYRWSLNVWRGLSVICLALSGIILAKATRAGTTDTLLLVAAVQAVPMCLSVGQDSLLVLVLASGSFYLLKTDRDIPAALVLTLALFKPQLPVLLALAVLTTGRRRFFAWFAAFGMALTVASMVYVGRAGVEQIIHAQRIGETGGYGVATMANLRALMAQLAGDQRLLSIAILAGAIVLTISVWRRSRSLDFAVASSVCLGLAFSFYVYNYDLVLLAIPLVIMANSFRQKDTLILAAVTSAPLHVLLQAAHLNALLVLPTLALGYLTLRLREVQLREPAYVHASN